MLRDSEYYDVEYNQKERSTYDIADEHGTYPKKIAREIKKWGYKLRDKSKAQKVALKTGRHSHPTRGKHLPSEVKQKISESLKTGRGTGHGSEADDGSTQQ